MPITIALFGATGNVGKELIEALKVKASNDHKFLVFSRTVAVNRKENIKEQENNDNNDTFQTIVLPCQDDGSSDNDALAKILSTHKVETAFLCVPQKIVHQCKEYVEQLLPAWKKAGIKRVVKVGTGNAKAYAYGRKHVEAEQAIRQAGLKLVVVEGGDYSTNPQWLGPAPPGAPYVLIDVFKGLSYLSYLGLGVFRSMGNVANFFGTVKEPFLDLRDFGEALAVVVLDAPKHEGQTYRVYAEAVTMQQVTDVYGQLLGRKLYLLDMSEKEVAALMEMEGFKGEMLELALEMFARFKEGVYEPDDTWDGVTKLTGKEPRKFEDFAKEKVAAGYKPWRFS